MFKWIGPLFAISFASSASFAAPIDGAFEDYIREVLQKKRVAGAAVLVTRKDATLYAQGFGLRDVEKQIPVDASTLFAIGSTTKAFTSALGATLVDEGRAQFDRPVRDYDAGFQLSDPIATEKATLRDLMSHRSGLPRHDLVWYGSELGREDLYARLRYLDFSAGFREKFQYCNLMYMAAGVVYERITGRTWEDLTLQRLLQPLQMTDTRLNAAEFEASPNHATPYTIGSNGDFVAIPARNIDAVAPAGSITSNLVDMGKWVRMQLSQGQLNGRVIVSSSALAETQTPAVHIQDAIGDLGALDYGMGWMLTSYRGRRWMTHDGEIDGFAAHVSFMPEDDLGVVVLTNSGEFSPELLGLDIYDQLLDLAPRKRAVRSDPVAPPTQDPEFTDSPLELTGFSGEYAHPAYGAVRVIVAAGQVKDADLLLSFHSMQAPVRHIGSALDFYISHQFNAPETWRTVRFEKDSSGRVIALLWKLDELAPEVRFTR